MVLTPTTQIPLGFIAPDFKLLNPVLRKAQSLTELKSNKATLIIFMCNHCPYVKAVIQRLINLQSDFSNQGVRLVGINCNDAEKYPDDSFKNMKISAEEWGINFPYVYDESQEIAKKYYAVCTPDIYVYGKERKLLYRGRIDDNWEKPDQVTKRDLKQAIDYILTENEVPEEQIPSMGCSIKWKAS